jgi:hypothetical protein
MLSLLATVVFSASFLGGVATAWSSGAVAHHREKSDPATASSSPPASDCSAAAKHKADRVVDMSSRHRSKHRCRSESQRRPYKGQSRSTRKSRRVFEEPPLPPLSAEPPAEPSESRTEESSSSPSRGATPPEEASGNSPVEEPPSLESQLGGPIAPFRFFSPESSWNEEVPADAPLDPNSAAIVETFDELVASEVSAGTGPFMNTTKWSTPVYTVAANQPTVPVELREHRAEPALSAAWEAVPLPPTAQPAAGTDGTLIVSQPSTDRLWEFHRLAHTASGWSAEWGGAMDNVSSNPGVFGPEAWPGGRSWWGASASSMSLVGGLITLEDLASGRINHALDLADPEGRAGVYSSPAERSDGRSANPLSLPEGAHLRLNPKLDLASLHLPRLTLMLAEAAQRYGIFITDYSTVVDFFGQDPTPTGTNPYMGPGGYFEGQPPRKLLASFPWSELELLKMELHASE